MADPVFVVLGSGPGIGLSTAALFAAQHFKTVALVSRNADRLQADKKALIAKAGREVDVETYPTDLSNFEQLRATLKSIEKKGLLGAVFFNAARIKPSELLTTEVEEIEEDFRTTNLALYITAQWAIPLLQSGPQDSKPAFFVTNSALPEQPLPFLLSLSAVKASQQNIVQSLHAGFGEKIHFGIVKVNGQVSTDQPNLNPDNIAKKIGGLYAEDSNWTLKLEIDP